MLCAACGSTVHSLCERPAAPPAGPTTSAQTKLRSVTDPEGEHPARRPASTLAANVSSLAEDAWNRLDYRRRLLLAGLSLRQGARRVRGSLMPVLTASAAAWIAYAIAHFGLGHPAPFFAPVAAWICLGFTYNRVPRKVLEIGAGAAIGVGIGELILINLGAGGWQLAIGLLGAALIARLVDQGDLFTIQAGVNAMVGISLGTLESQPAGAGPSRLIDALVGAGVALVLAILLPGDVLNRPRRYASSVLTEFARAFSMLAEGLCTGNAEWLRDAHAQLRGVDRIIEDARSAWRSSEQIVSLNPAMRRHRPQIDELGRQLDLSARAVRTGEMVLRQSRGMLAETGPDPGVAKLLDDSAATLHALAGSVLYWHPPWRARTSAKDLAADCGPDPSTLADWRHTALLTVMRSMAIDLLQLTGLSRQQARQYLPGTADRVVDEEFGVRGDEASGVWGTDELPPDLTEP